MTTLREAAQQALEALVSENSLSAVAMQQRMDAITVLKDALAEPMQELVAWQDTAKPTELVCAEHWEDIDPIWHWMYRPLYTAPPQRKPLSEDEIFAIENDIPDDVISDRAWTICFARAIEAAHGIK